MENELSLDKLKPGMIIARDIYTELSGLIATENAVLTQRGIERLKACHIDSIFVFEKEGEKISGIKTALEKVKESESFQEFFKAYQSSLAEARSILDDAVKLDEPTDAKRVFELIDRVVIKGTNGIDIFDMLNCMRDVDDSAYTHSMNVAIICRVFGTWLKLPKEEVQVLEMAGLFHDIGKLLIPQEVLNKKDKLTPSEYIIVKKHVDFGYHAMEDKDIDERVKKAILCHHEKCDASGYPAGFSSEDIDDFSKIVAIADVYDAMTAKRVYRDSVCPFIVIEDMEKNGLQKFDPRFILPLLHILVQSYIGSDVLLSDNRIGSVIMINESNLSKPVLKIGKEYLDLSKEKGISIKAIL